MPGPSDVHPSQIRHRAELCVRAGRPGDAVPLFMQYLARCPDDGYAIAMLALCLSDLDRDAEARKTAQRAIAAAPEEPMAHYALALGVLNDRAYFVPRVLPWSLTGGEASHQRLAAAEVHLREAVRLDPTDAFMHGQLAWFRFMREAFDEAEAAAREGLRQDPQQPTCREVLTRLALHRQNFDEASALIRESLEEHPEDATTHTLAARLSLAEARHDDALAFAVEAKRLAPGDADAHDALLDAYRAQHRLMRWPIAWAQRLHRLAARWPLPALAAMGLGACLAVQVALLLAGVALGVDWLPMAGVAAGLTLVTGGVLLFLVPRHVATMVLLTDARTRHAVDGNLAAESALVTGAAVALACLGPALPFINDRPAVFLPALAATALPPALFVWLAGEPGSDRRRLLGGFVAACATWAFAVALMLGTQAPLAPIALLLPWCVTVGMAGWLASRDGVVTL